MENSKCNEETKPYVPPAREANHGVTETTALISRGAAFAFPAYFIGKWLTPIFSRQKHNGFGLENASKLSGWTMAGFFGLLGAYQASRDARADIRQLNRMQHSIEKLDKQNYRLKKELKAQLCGEGTITEYDDAWDVIRDPDGEDEDLALEEDDGVEVLIAAKFKPKTPDTRIEGADAKDEKLTQEIRERD